MSVTISVPIADDRSPCSHREVLTFNITPTRTTGNLAFSSGPAIDATTSNLTYTRNVVPSHSLCYGPRKTPTELFRTTEAFIQFE